MSLRLTLVCHGATSATRAARFPQDEALETSALRRAGEVSFGRVDAAWTAPARRAVQTAEALGLEAVVAPGLRDLGMGAWAGRTLVEVGAELERWITDPAVAPPGGECVRDLLVRVGAWMDGLYQGRRIVAVTHASVIRAAMLLALEAPAASFWRIDVAPLGRVTLQGRPGRWTLSC